MNRQERTDELVRRLPVLYPDAHCALDFSNALELLVATILSAQCTDERVNRVTPALFRRCPAAEDYTKIPVEELEQLVHQTGFYRSKAKSLRGMASALVVQHAGQVPRDMAALRELPGVGRKTASVLLGNAFGMQEGVTVDTHVARLSERLRLSKHSDPEKIEADLMRLVPREHWTIWSHWLIAHGRARCTARSPDCPACELRDLCPTAGKHGPPAQKKRSTAPAKAAKMKSTPLPNVLPLP